MQLFGLSLDFCLLPRIACYITMVCNKVDLFNLFIKFINHQCHERLGANMKSWPPFTDVHGNLLSENGTVDLTRIDKESVKRSFNLRSLFFGDKGHSLRLTKSLVSERQNKTYHRLFYRGSPSPAFIRLFRLMATWPELQEC